MCRSVGALAELFDISCLPERTYEVLTDIAFDAWEKAPPSVTAQRIINGLSEFHNPLVLGQHYFITNPTGSGLSPKWDFTSASEAGHSNAFVVGAKTGDVPAPTDPHTDIDWLSLSAALGDLADQVYRVVTRGGQPPSSVSIVFDIELDVCVLLTREFSVHLALRIFPSDMFRNIVSGRSKAIVISHSRSRV